MTLFYFHPEFLLHNTGDHPENPDRLRAVMERLEERQLLSQCRRPDWEPATTAQLTMVHTPEHVEAVDRFIRAGGGRIEQDTVVSAGSWRAALMAAGAACDAVRRVVQGEADNAFCLARPPGHHALTDQPMGFCLFNHVAVAARVAIRECGLERILILDWDVHHGNGTQAIFWEDPSVGFLSMHRYPFYPGTGAADETGGGAGAGFTVNLPIQFGTPAAVQIERFRRATETLAEKVRPQLVLVSAGFDSHVRDPIGSLQLESEDFVALSKIALSVANAHAQGRLVSLLEGGYNPAALAESVQFHLETLLNQ